MLQHLQLDYQFRNLNAKVKPGGVVYILDVTYYRDAFQGVFERAGRIRPDIETRYVSREELAPKGGPYYVMGFQGNPSELASLGKVSSLGVGLLRVEPES